MLKDEIVLLGAHFDSVAAATGATDNATGCAAMMEAMRILKAVGAKPRRTIRIALWGGEEQGLLGSRAYVREHFGGPGDDDAEAGAWQAVGVFQLGQRHRPRARHLAAGQHGGRGRSSNSGLRRCATSASSRSGRARWRRPITSSFDNVGIPAFQFMVDRLEYNSRTHHSNMDFYDRVQRDDMVQQATVVAVFAYNAAMRDEKLPRKPLPKPQPARTDGQ